MKKLNKLISILREKKLSLALAESCSGGYASYLITKIPGCSKVFKGAIVVYSLDSKNRLLQLPFTIIKETQGVSAKVAALLANNIRKKFKSDIGASLVGFAGPQAKIGSKVGTIFLGIAFKGKIKTKKNTLKGRRDNIRKKASHLLIDLIYDTIR